MPKRMKWGLGAFLLLGFIFSYLGEWLYSYDSLSTVEAAPKRALVVVLAGGRGRIEAAFQLFSLSNSAALLVAGAGPHTTLATLMRNNLDASEAAALGNRKEAIFVETESRNTIENAYAVASFLRQHAEYREIILITSSYHMRRSLLIFGHVLGKELNIFAYNGPKESIQGSNWFSSPKGIYITGKELTKLALANLLLPQLTNF